MGNYFSVCVCVHLGCVTFFAVYLFVFLVISVSLSLKDVELHATLHLGRFMTGSLRIASVPLLFLFILFAISVIRSLLIAMFTWGLTFISKMLTHYFGLCRRAFKVHQYLVSHSTILGFPLLLFGHYFSTV